MLRNIKRRTEGFTIIEVLIVLAIAGLILLIVFLAVPALQRNARNTSIKSDVAAVLGGITEYESVNSGSAPTNVAGTGTVNYTPGTPTTAKVQGTTTVATVAAAPGAPPAGGIIDILVGKTCAGTASTRAIAAYYSVETTAGNIQQCQDS